MTQAEQPAIGRQRFERPAGHPMMVRESAFEASFPKASFWDDDPREPPPVERYGSAAVIRITGPLTHHAEWWFDSYDAISSRLDAALAATPRPTSIVMVLDTPGGDASGCFELAASMRKRCEAARVPLVAYVEGMACSAGYALACAADRIVSSPSSIVGSIGVVTGIVDYTGALAMCGVKVRLIKSGARKTDGSPYEPTSREAEDSIQGLIDGLAGLFFAHVASSRPKAGGVDGVAALEAGVFLGAQGVSLGLVDEVGTLDTAIATPRPAPITAPAPAPAEASRRATAPTINRATTSSKGKHMTTKPSTKPRLADGDEDENKDDASAAMEECDLAKLRTAMEMPDASAQEVVDAAADRISGATEGDDAGEQAKRAAEIAASRSSIAQLSAKVDELVTEKRAREKADAEAKRCADDDAWLAAEAAARGLNLRAEDKAEMTGLMRKDSATGRAAVSFALKQIKTPPGGSVSGSASAASTGAAADAVSSSSMTAGQAIEAARAAIDAESPSMSNGSPAYFRAVQERARKDNPGAFKRSVN